MIYSKNDSWVSDWWDLEFVWVLARKPLEIGSKERNRLIKKSHVAMKEKYFSYDLSKMKDVEQGTDRCRYFSPGLAL